MGPMPNMNNNPLANKTPMDIDAMIKDIDNKIAEIEKEEAKKKQEIEKIQKNNEDHNKKMEEIKPISTPIDEPKKIDLNLDMSKPSEPVKPVKVENSKPKIKVDNDSVIVDEHVVSDDEFFDDFFGD